LSWSDNSSEMCNMVLLKSGRGLLPPPMGTAKEEYLKNKLGVTAS
jgi:hypothetical protein